VNPVSVVAGGDEQFGGSVEPDAEPVDHLWREPFGESFKLAVTGPR
jgi:hypothetical protein